MTYDYNKRRKKITVITLIGFQFYKLTHACIPAWFGGLTSARGCVVGLAPRAVAKVAVAADELAAVHARCLRLAV